MTSPQDSELEDCPHGVAAAAAGAATGAVHAAVTHQRLDAAGKPSEAGTSAALCDAGELAQWQPASDGERKLAVPAALLDRPPSVTDQTVD